MTTWGVLEEASYRFNVEPDLEVLGFKKEENHSFQTKLLRATGKTNNELNTHFPPPLEIELSPQR